MRASGPAGRSAGVAALCAAALCGACATVPDGSFPERWRVSSTATDRPSGESTSTVVRYDARGHRVRNEILGPDAEIRETVVYRYDADGRILERVDIEPDDLDRYRYRTDDDGRITMRLTDNDGDGRFGGYVRYAYGPDGLATTRQYLKLDGDRADVTGTEGELTDDADYSYRGGRLDLRSMDRGADGDVDELTAFGYDDEGRLTSSTVRRDGELRSTTRYTYERGPCDLGALIPEAAAFCVDG